MKPSEQAAVSYVRLSEALTHQLYHQVEDHGWGKVYIPQFGGLLVDLLLVRAVPKGREGDKTIHHMAIVQPFDPEAA